MQPMNDPNMMAPAHFHHPQQQQQVPLQDQEAILLDQIRSQIEFYFSDHNLQKDTFMQSILTSKEHFGAAPVHVIANFPRVRELYASGRAGHYVHANMAPAADVGFVCRAMMNSSWVRVSNDGQFLVPVHSAFVWSQQQQQKQKQHNVPNRSSETRAAESPASMATSESSKGGVQVHPLPETATVVVVHDIPVGCSQEAVMEVFTTGAVKPKSAYKDANGTWFLTFVSKEFAMQAILSSHERTIGGRPIHARLQTEELTISREASPSTRDDEQSPPQLQSPPPMHQPNVISSPQGMPPMQQFAAPHPGMMVQYPMVQYPFLQQGMVVAMPLPQPQIGYAVMPPDYTLPHGPPPQHVYVPPPRSEDGDRFEGSIHSAHSGSHTRRRSRKKATTRSMRSLSASSMSSVGSEPPKELTKEMVTETTLEAAPVTSEEPPKDPNKEPSEANKQTTKPPYRDKSGKGKRRVRRNAVQNNSSTGNKPDQTHNNKKNHKKKGKRNSPRNSPTKMLSDENFPALAGSDKVTHSKDKSTPERPAYAEALLKATTKTSSKPQRDVEHVENQLQQMTVTDEKVEQAPSQPSGETKA